MFCEIGGDLNGFLITNPLVMSPNLLLTALADPIAGRTGHCYYFISSYTYNVFCLSICPSGILLVSAFVKFFYRFPDTVAYI
ncbi:MAG: hypothetical protein CVU06_12845, partial [Bacteroidetes bacterium HGW-Bacteroidetes-22]